MSFIPRNFLMIVVAAALFEKAKGYCNSGQYSCQSIVNAYYSTSSCFTRSQMCDGQNNCNNGRDEMYCDDFKTRFNGGCLSDWNKCKDGRCIPSTWWCDSYLDCEDMSDEIDCAYMADEPLVPTTTYATFQIEQKEDDPSHISEAKENLTTWFLNRRKEGTTVNKWGHQLPRIAIALYMTNSHFAIEDQMGEEMGYEITIQLLSRLIEEKKLKSNELAPYIHAMLVTCINPRDFYGHDLVSELRACVDAGNHTNPFEYLVLCNAGDKMTSRDAEKISAAYETQDRPFWTDTQAMATMALTCLSTRGNVSVDERVIIDMSQELKRRQFRNGTVDNIRTTGLVLQALFATHTYSRDFDLKAAIKVLLQSQKLDGSIGTFLDSYYIIPVLFNSSLLNISSSHCQKPTNSEEEALTELQKRRQKKIHVQYSVWVGSDLDLRRTWNLKVPVNSTFYHIIEIANKLDSRQNIGYNVIEGKPYVSSVSGLQDDLEMGLFWYTYVRRLGSSDDDPKLVEESPVDIKIKPNQELILWYRTEQ